MGDLLHFTDCDGADPCSCDRAGLPLTTGEGNTAQELRGRIEWYVQCLRDAWAGKSVRGMAEARAGYEAALAECGRLREQLDAARQALEQIDSETRFTSDTRAGYVVKRLGDIARAALGVEGPAG